MGAFEQYLNALRHRSQVEADAFARKQMLIQKGFDAAGAGIQAIGRTVAEKKARENEYRFVADEAGILNPDNMPGVTTPEQDRFSELRTKLLERQKPNIKWVRATPGMDESAKQQAKAEGGDRAWVESSKAQEKVTAGKEREYLGSEAFKREFGDVAWQKFLRNNPVGSPTYLKVMSGFGKNKKPDALETYRAKKEIDKEFRAPSRAAGSYRSTKDFSKAIYDLDSEWRGNLMIDEDIKKQALERIEQTAAENKDNSDLKALENATRNLMSDLLKLKNATPKIDEAVPSGTNRKKDESKKMKYISALRAKMSEYPEATAEKMRDEFSEAVKRINLAPNWRRAADEMKAALKRLEKIGIADTLSQFDK